MPPPAPRTATFVWRAAEEENWREWVAVRAAARKNMAREEEGSRERRDADAVLYSRSEQLGLGVRYSESPLRPTPFTTDPTPHQPARPRTLRPRPAARSQPPM